MLTPSKSNKSNQASSERNTTPEKLLTAILDQMFARAHEASPAMPLLLT